MTSRTCLSTACRRWQPGSVSNRTSMPASKNPLTWPPWTRPLARYRRMEFRGALVGGSCCATRACTPAAWPACLFAGLSTRGTRTRMRPATSAGPLPQQLGDGFRLLRLPCAALWSSSSFVTCRPWTPLAQTVAEDAEKGGRSVSHSTEDDAGALTPPGKQCWRAEDVCKFAPRPARKKRPCNSKARSSPPAACHSAWTTWRPPRGRRGGGHTAPA